MGIERDYLMRQLMMLLEVIQKIFSFRQKGQLKEAEDEIKYFYSFLNIEKNFHELTIESFLEYLINDKKFENSHLELIAFVLKEQGEMTEDTGQQQDFFRKSYFLLEKVERESTSFSIDRQLKLTELRSFLN